jgi:hypothetical protein
MLTQMLVCHSESTEKYVVDKTPQCFSKELYVTSIQHLMQRWIKCVDNEGDSVEK